MVGIIQIQVLEEEMLQLFNYSRGITYLLIQILQIQIQLVQQLIPNASSGTYPNLTLIILYNGTGTSPKTYVNAAITNLFT